MRVVVALVLVGCGGPVSVTPCGSGSDTEEDLSFAEAAAVAAYAPRFEKSETRVCAALRGISIKRKPGTRHGWWANEAGAILAGRYYPGIRVIELAEVQAIDSAYFHEVGHALDEAFGYPEAPDHAGWFERGLYAAEYEWRAAMVKEYRAP